MEKTGDIFNNFEELVDRVSSLGLCKYGENDINEAIEYYNKHIDVLSKDLHKREHKYVRGADNFNMIDKPPFLERLICIASGYGDIAMIKWLFSLDDIKNFDMTSLCKCIWDCFQIQCPNVARVIAEEAGLQSDLYIVNQIFYDSCMGGDIETAKWALTIDPKIKHLDKYEYNEIFADACSNENQMDEGSEFVEWLYSTNLSKKINIHADDNEAFRNACLKGNIKIMEFLLSLDTLKSFKIHYHNDYIFKDLSEREENEKCDFLINLYKSEGKISEKLFRLIKEHYEYNKVKVDNDIYKYVNDKYLSEEELKIKHSKN